MPLFDDVSEVQPTPRLLQEQAFQDARAQRTRDLATARQHRCRDRKRRAKRGAPAAPGVTPKPDGVTLFSQAAPEVETPEMALLVAAIEEVSRTGGKVSRGPILQAMDAIARREGVQIFNAALFLESAAERGALPHFAPADWVSVPRDVLRVLYEEARR